ncbi:UDP-glucose 4-epimerase family protein [Vibrio gangliei]|uniref:UDP-glucose 4-epimerase family protein n=1 Tax=Vibrio gangliei TaxID=2077090 RepID=UPI000D0156F1|nr:SDR family oxidoreductase [Vibrio gangliei]
MKILVTGATGFVGQKVVEKALEKEMEVSAIARNSKLVTQQKSLPQVEWHHGELTPDFDWSSCLDGVDCVIHCAARVHQMNEDASVAQKNYDDANFRSTLNLAHQAQQVGVKRFIFLSSIKVNGESTELNEPFTRTVEQEPEDPYGLSKYKAEQALQTLSKDSGLDVVIIRPPLVYGPGVKANFQAMMKWVCRGIPLPLGAIHNKRSMVYLDNLVDLILTCTQHNEAINEVFLVSDDHDISTSELLSQIKQAANSSTWLIPVPMKIFTIAAKLLNKPQIAQRLCGSLQVDISHTKKQLNWQPPISWEQGITKTVLFYLNNKNTH